jgi:hypothetical protein
MNRRLRYGDRSYQRTQPIERLPPQVVRHMFSFGETLPGTTNQFRRPSLQFALSKHSGRLLEDIIESESDRKIVGMIMGNTNPLIGNANRLAIVATVKNYPQILKLAVSNGANNFDDIGLAAIDEGHINIVRYAVSKGANNFDDMVKNASQRGHFPIVRYFVEELNYDDLNEVAEFAALGGHLEIVHYAISKGAEDINAMMGIARMAAIGGHLPIVKLSVRRGVRDYNLIADAAAQGGSLAVVKYAVEKGARDFDLIAISAAENGHVNIVAYAINEGALDFDSIVESGAENGHLDVVKYGLKKQAEVPDDLEGLFTFDDMVNLAQIGAEKGHLNIVEYAAMKTPLDFNQIALIAIEGDYIDILNYAIENERRQGVPINLNDLAFSATQSQSIDSIAYLLNQGATNREQILNIVNEEGYLDVIESRLE